VLLRLVILSFGNNLGEIHSSIDDRLVVMLPY